MCSIRWLIIPLHLIIWKYYRITSWIYVYYNDIRRSLRFPYKQQESSYMNSYVSAPQINNSVYCISTIPRLLQGKTEYLVLFTVSDRSSSQPCTVRGFQIPSARRTFWNPLDYRVSLNLTVQLDFGKVLWNGLNFIQEFFLTGLGEVYFSYFSWGPEGSRWFQVKGVPGTLWPRGFQAPSVELKGFHGTLEPSQIRPWQSNNGSLQITNITA